MAACDQAAVPAKYRIRVHQQLYAAEHVPWQPVQQRRQERPVDWSKPHPSPCRVAAPAPSAGGAEQGSPRPCRGRSSGAGATWQTRGSQPGSPVAVARSTIIPRRSTAARGHGGERLPTRLLHPRTPPPTRADGFSAGAGLIADRSGQLAAQDRVLVPQHQQFRVLRRPATHEHRRNSEQLPGHLVQQAHDHGRHHPSGPTTPRSPAAMNFRAAHCGQVGPLVPCDGAGLRLLHEQLHEAAAVRASSGARCARLPGGIAGDGFPAHHAYRYGVALDWRPARHSPPGHFVTRRRVLSPAL